MKLIDILKELEKPKNIYNPDYNKPKQDPDSDFLSKGFRLKNTISDPETGKTGGEVEYLPEFDKLKKDLLKMRRSVQPFKYSSNLDIAKLAKELNTSLTKAAQMMHALDKMIDLQSKFLNRRQDD